jgi:hypothetical protein
MVGSTVRQSSLAALLALVAGSASAQAINPEAGVIKAPRNPDDPVIQIEGGATAERHSNIFKLADGVDPSGLFGKSNRADTVLRGNLGVIFDRDISLQRLRLEGRLEPTKYFTYSKLDFFGYSGSANLDWNLGSSIYGTAGVMMRQNLTSFVGVTYGSDKNLERRNKIYGSAGLKITPNWSAFVGADHLVLDNSLSVFQSANYRLNGTEGGLRFAPGTGTELSFVGRHQKATYPNTQTFDLFGNVLPAPISNDYKQNDALVRLQVRPSEDSLIGGQFGYTKRSYASVPSRDFSGPTALLQMNWRPSGAFRMNTQLSRGLESANILIANYVDVTELMLLPSIQLTGKMTLNGRLVYSKVDWKGDPGLVTSNAFTNGVRKDDLTTLGLQLMYDYSRNLSLSAEARQERRTSNYNAYKFVDNIMLFGILAKF